MVPISSPYVRPAVSLRLVTVAIVGVVVAAAISIGGCASYESRPLPTGNDLLTRLPGASDASDRMPLAPLRSHRFDPSDGFDSTELATLAVLNNPDLKLARADAGVIQAQAFQTSLLPDPQIALTTEHVLASPEGFTRAFTGGLTIDFAAILAHPSLLAAATADQRKTRLNLLWQEWQTVAQARVLFVKVVAQEKTLTALERYQGVFDDRWTRTRTAAERGLLTNDSVTPYLTALQDVNRQVNDLRRQRNQSRHDLNALVGVGPDIELVLNDEGTGMHIDDAAVRATLAETLLRRPDVMALQAGYEAEDDRYRGALIAQFPGFTFGPTRARDTSNVNTAGFSLGITLPVFNRNRGNIAIEKATRAKLNVEYQGRLDSTTIEVDRLLAEQALLERQLDEIGSALADLTKVGARAANAFAASNVDALVLTNVQSSLVAKQVEQFTIEELLSEQRIALRTLITTDLPANPANASGSP